MNIVHTHGGFLLKRHRQITRRLCRLLVFVRRKTCTLNPLHPKGFASFAGFADFFLPLREASSHRIRETNNIARVRVGARNSKKPANPASANRSNSLRSAQHVQPSPPVIALTVRSTGEGKLWTGLSARLER